MYQPYLVVDRLSGSWQLEILLTYRRGIGWHLLKASEELISQMCSSGEVYLHCRMIDLAPFNMYTKAGYRIVKTDNILVLLTLQRRKHLMCKKLLVPYSPSESDESGSDQGQTSWIHAEVMSRHTIFLVAKENHSSLVFPFCKIWINHLSTVSDLNDNFGFPSSKYSLPSFYRCPVSFSHSLLCSDCSYWCLLFKYSLRLTLWLEQESNLSLNSFLVQFHNNFKFLEISCFISASINFDWGWNVPWFYEEESFITCLLLILLL